MEVAGYRRFHAHKRRYTVVSFLFYLSKFEIRACAEPAQYITSVLKNKMINQI